jgi:Protein of unknown function DUF262/Protein of unknown function (DUF1524)
MEAHVKTVREILHSGDQFLVPFFQRQYSWTKKEWQNLYADVLTLIDGDEDTRHFLGPLVCTPFHPIPGEAPRFQLIDGQQRLTTLTLALAALRDVVRPNFHDFADEIHEDYLIHRRRQGLSRFKVVPRLEDRHSYELAIDGTAPGVIAGTGIIGCHSFFKRAWKTPVADGGEPVARRILVALTARMSLVAITVDGENPYEIFESLNWKGLPLEEADLIRNFLFMQVAPAEQGQFHESWWKPYESRFEAVGRFERIPPTQFYRNYLMRDGHYCRNKTAYLEFKRQNLARGLTTNDQVAELQRFATFELWLQRPDLCEREYLRERLAELQQLDVTTAHPLLLHLLDRHERGHVHRADLDECLRDLASFVIRRTICGESTRAYGRWFPEAIPQIRLSPRPNVELRDYWISKGWPDDATFIARLVEFPIYQRERKKSRHLLERLEQGHRHCEPVDFENLQIEHVLPQTLENDPSGQSWKGMLGISWEQEHARWVHTLGNLTLTGYNQVMGNDSFTAKQQVFAQSNVSLNTHFGGLAHWTTEEIKRRTIRLGTAITKLWPRPAGAPYALPPAIDELFDETVDSTPLPSDRQPHIHGRLKIIIRWSMLGQERPDEIIQESTGAATFAEFIGRLLARGDPRIRGQLKQITVARLSKKNPEKGYRLSENPERDFLNKKAGRPFGHNAIPGTAPVLFVFTGTHHEKKVEDISILAGRLGLTSGSVDAS